MSRDILTEPALVAATPEAPATNGAPPLIAVGVGGARVGSAVLDELGHRIGVKDIPAHQAKGWFTKLIGYYLRRYKAKAGGHTRGKVKPGQTVSDAARSTILRACVKSAISGAAAGSVSTAAALITAQTEGIGGLVAIPVAALGIGGEMMYRSFLHIDLTVKLAEIFEVEFDATDPDDIFRLYALVFKTNEESDGPGDGESLGKNLVHQVKHLESAEVGEEIGNKVLGESVVRNIVPFVGIVSSAVMNFIVTRRLGDTVRRYMRYQRAMETAFDRAVRECGDHLDLLVEGVWFIFTADGRLAPEETVTLVKLLEKLDPVTGHATLARFVEDELDWADRIEQLPESMRDSFLHALEVAACVDKSVGLPERKILRRAAHHLGREFDMTRLEAMVHEFEQEGVLGATE
jgi:predicted membrane protein